MMRMGKGKYVPAQSRRGLEKEAPAVVVIIIIEITAAVVVIINVVVCGDDMEMCVHKDLVKLCGKRSAFQ